MKSKNNQQNQLEAYLRDFSKTHNKIVLLKEQLLGLATTIREFTVMAELEERLYSIVEESRNRKPSSIDIKVYPYNLACIEAKIYWEPQHESDNYIENYDVGEKFISTFIEDRFSEEAEKLGIDKKYLGRIELYCEFPQ